MSNLTKAYPIRLTLDQNKALCILESKGYNKSKFIRVALQEKLERDYRNIIQDKRENLPF